MSVKTKEMLEAEIITELEAISSTIGEDEIEKKAKTVAVLHQLLNEEEKLEIDRIAKEKDLKDRKVDRIIRSCLEVAGITLPWVIYSYWMRQGFKFEEEGSITSSFFRNIINVVKPKR